MTKASRVRKNLRSYELGHKDTNLLSSRVGKKKGVPKGQACWVKACDSVNSSRHRMERLYAPEGDAYIDQAWGPVNEYQCD